MPANNDSAQDAVPLQLTVSRLIDAPRALVFSVWTSQKHARRWWGPQGFSNVSCRLDATVGGTFRIAMRAPEGTIHTKIGTYREIVPPERLVFTYAWEDANGDPGPEMHVVVTFEPQGDKTLLTLRQTGFEDMPARDSHLNGWTSCFERFADYMMHVEG